jgi:hypothetical protein
MQSSIKKKRSQSCYDKIVTKVTKWYEHLEKERAKPEVINPNTKQSPKRKELKPLDHYLGLIKKPKD